MAKEQNNNHNMMYLSIVAIVAIVAVVMLVGNNGATTPNIQTTENQENLAGQAIKVKTGEVVQDNHPLLYFQNGINMKSDVDALLINVQDPETGNWNVFKMYRNGEFVAQEIKAEDITGVSEIFTEDITVSDLFKAEDAEIDGLEARGADVERMVVNNLDIDGNLEFSGIDCLLSNEGYIICGGVNYGRDVIKVGESATIPILPDNYQVVFTSYDAEEKTGDFIVRNTTYEDIKEGTYKSRNGVKLEIVEFITSGTDVMAEFRLEVERSIVKVIE
jgi:hypothetical protein